MFSIKTINKIIIDIVLASSILAGSSVNKDQICTANVVDFPKIDISSLIVVPMAKIKAALSPMTLPIASKVAVKIPGKADGNHLKCRLTVVSS